MADAECTTVQIPQDCPDVGSNGAEGQSLTSRRLTVSYWVSPVRRSTGRGVSLPYLRLLGRWLERAGFAIGSTVRVSVSPGKLMIEIAAPATSAAAREYRSRRLANALPPRAVP